MAIRIIGRNIFRTVAAIQWCNEQGIEYWCPEIEGTEEPLNPCDALVVVGGVKTIFLACATIGAYDLKGKPVFYFGEDTKLSILEWAKKEVK